MKPGSVDIDLLLQPDGLYHLATAQEWDDYQGAGSIEPGSLFTEGFVHCSWGHQVAGTVARHFAGIPDLIALLVDPEALGELLLVDEDSYDSGQAFPHAYGAIPVQAVRRVVPIG